MLNKREICRFIEKIGGSFDTDVRLWKIPNKNRKLFIDFLENNGIEYRNVKNCFYRIEVENTDGDCFWKSIIYIKIEKPYRKPKNATYTVCYADRHARQVLHGIKDYRTLKYIIRNMDEIQHLEIYVDNVEVCKSLWR